jgi:hypothetical protein
LELLVVSKVGSSPKAQHRAAQHMPHAMAKHGNPACKTRGLFNAVQGAESPLPARCVGGGVVLAVARPWHMVAPWLRDAGPWSCCSLPRFATKSNLCYQGKDEVVSKHPCWLPVMNNSATATGLPGMHKRLAGA